MSALNQALRRARQIRFSARIWNQQSHPSYACEGRFKAETSDGVPQMVSVWKRVITLSKWRGSVLVPFMRRARLGSSANLSTYWCGKQYAWYVKCAAFPSIASPQLPYLNLRISSASRHEEIGNPRDDQEAFIRSVAKFSEIFDRRQEDQMENKIRTSRPQS